MLHIFATPAPSGMQMGPQGAERPPIWTSADGTSLGTSWTLWIHPEVHTSFGIGSLPVTVSHAGVRAANVTETSAFLLRVGALPTLIETALDAAYSPKQGQSFRH